MKKSVLSFLLLLFFSLFTYSQKYEEYRLENKDTTYVFNYTPSLKFILDDFFEGCQEYDIPLDRFSRFEGIYATENMKIFTGRDFFGLTFFGEKKDFILVNNKIPGYLPTFMSAVVYHELYHFILKSHYHCIIKNPGISGVVKEFVKGYPKCLYVLQGGRDINIEKIIREWGDESKKEYFLFLKDNYQE